MGIEQSNLIHGGDEKLLNGVNGKKCLVKAKILFENGERKGASATSRLSGLKTTSICCNESISKPRKHLAKRMKHSANDKNIETPKINWTMLTWVWRVTLRGIMSGGMNWKMAQWQIQMKKERDQISLM